MSRLRDTFRFSKPKTIGFGISREFYLSVLAATASLPSIAEIVEPKGGGGAVKGFGAPLTDAKDKALLHQPMTRGGYVVASLDRKTVLRLLVMPREEIGFDPEAVLRNMPVDEVTPEIATRFRSTWFLLQLSFEAHDPMVHPSLAFLLEVAQWLSQRTGGLVADPLAQRYLLPEDVWHAAPGGVTDARDLVAVRTRTLGGEVAISTAGLQKLALPELEMRVPDASRAETGVQFLLSLTQTILNGQTVGEGAEVGARSAPFVLRTGGCDPATWGNTPCLELVPKGSTPVATALDAWRAG